MEKQVHAAFKGKHVDGGADIKTIDLYVTFGISEPIEQEYSYSVPRYGQTGVSSSTTYGNVTSYGNTASYSGTTYHTPSFGVTGYSQHSGTIMMFRRYVGVLGFTSDTPRNAKGGRDPGAAVFELSAESIGTGGDLREVLPYLLVVADDFLGSNTPQGAETVELSKFDERVADLVVQAQGMRQNSSNEVK
jgi:hypothetical protein